MIIFALLQQKIDFEQSEFQKVSLALAKPNLLLLPILWVLGKIFIFANFLQKVNFERSQLVKKVRNTLLILMICFEFIASIKKMLF